MVQVEADLTVETIATKPIEGQTPGTSGLRKKTKVFMEGTPLGERLANGSGACEDSSQRVGRGRFGAPKTSLKSRKVEDREVFGQLCPERL